MNAEESTTTAAGNGETKLTAEEVAAVMSAGNGEDSGGQSTSEKMRGAMTAMDASETAVAERAPEGPALAILEESDLVNTRWTVSFTPRPEAWRGGEPCEQEFALLKDGSVRWAGEAGGRGVGGRWQLRGETLEVIRTTPLGLVTGRDYYMSIVQARVTDDLQFEIEGITRSYNWLFPVAVVADWRAKRLPGRFAMSDATEDDEEEGSDSGGGGFSLPRPSDFNL